MEPTPTTLEAPATSRSSNTGLRLAIGGAIAVLAAGLAFVVLGQGADPSEGAETPEAAIEALVAAFEASDLEAALDTLVPGERDVADPSVRDVLSELGRIDLLADNIDLSAIPGFDIEVIDLSLSSNPVGDDVAMVDIRGTVRLTIFGLDLPLGPAVTDSDIIPLSLDEIPSPPPTPLDLSLATVRIDGGWFVSIGHTIAELQRADRGWPVPDPARAITPRGADSPDEAAQAIAAALNPLDPASLIAMLNPGEASAAHRHAANFLADAEAWAAENVSFSIDELNYRVEVDGDFADVHVDVLVMTITNDDAWTDEVHTSTIRYENGCINISDSRQSSVDSNETEMYLIPGQTIEDDGSITFCPVEETGLGLLAGGLLGTSSRPPTIGLVRHEGQWYLSPTRTFLNQMMGGIRNLPDGGGRELIASFLMPFDQAPMDSGGSWSTIESEPTPTSIVITETTASGQEG